MTFAEIRDIPVLFSGVFDLEWWQFALIALALTHVTIAAVTIFLHRHQAHRALELHPIASHFFRTWLWMTTGMVTKEWAAIHRKHHAKCETVDDPHSPQVLGLNRVLWGGVVLYVYESRVKDTIERYGHGTPDDWLEHNLYSKYQTFGLTIMGTINVSLFGIVPGLIILLTQIIWIPFWAAGVINGIGHYFGYRNFDCADASTNIVPWGILIGGEELHNNHHTYPTSAKLSNKWHEFDIGWMYICMMQALGLATVKKVAPTPKLAGAKAVADAATLQAVIANRYDVLAKYAKSLRATYSEEVAKLRAHSPQDAEMMGRFKRWISRDHKALAAPQKQQLAEVLAKSKPLETVYTMREELSALWERSSASKEQLLRDLQDWCQRAEASGIRQLEEFSLKLRCYC